MECMNRFFHELYLIILYKIKQKNHKGIFFLKYDVADKVAQQEYSNIKFYVSTYIYIYIQMLSYYDFFDIIGLTKCYQLDWLWFWRLWALLVPVTQAICYGCGVTDYFLDLNPNPNLYPSISLATISIFNQQPIT